MTADSLLEGPRGRGLCLALAHRLHQQLWGSLFHAANHPRDADRRAALIESLHDVDPESLSSGQVAATFVPAIAESIGHAKYWQEPDDEDVVAAHPDVIEALVPLATAICSAPSTSWWSAPVDLTQLRYTDRYDGHEDESAHPPKFGQATEALANWRTEANAGTHSWWSTPAGKELLWTTRPLPGLGSTELVWEEDTLSHPAARIWLQSQTHPDEGANALTFPLGRKSLTSRLRDHKLVPQLSSRRREGERPQRGLRR